MRKSALGSFHDSGANPVDPRPTIRNPPKLDPKPFGSKASTPDPWQRQQRLRWPVPSFLAALAVVFASGSGTLTLQIPTTMGY